MDNNKPLSPHIQIYSWNISSLISISHRITGVINIVVLTIICFWIASFLFGNSIYVIVQNILNSFFGKFLVIGITWSFSFQILSEIRHLFWDAGYGYDLKHAYISGGAVVFCSLLLTILTWSIIYLSVI